MPKYVPGVISCRVCDFERSLHSYLHQEGVEFSFFMLGHRDVEVTESLTVPHHCIL
jgi:hypothetical protein